MTYFDYKITNLVNNKIYIGKTSNIKNRFNGQIAAARRKDPNDYSKIHRAMNKYSINNFIIEQLDQYSIESEALQAQIEFIKNLNTTDDSIGYNISHGGDGPSGYKHTEEAKEKMSTFKK